MKSPIMKAKYVISFYFLFLIHGIWSVGTLTLYVIDAFPCACNSFERVSVCFY